MADAETLKTPEEKIAFIQSLPFELGAGEVIQKGKEAGLDFSRSYVYNARRLARETAAKASDAVRKEKSAAATRSKNTKAAQRKRRVKRGDKAAFVRTMPNASVPDVVKAALAQGIKLTAQTVYATRSGDTRRKKSASRAVSKAKNGTSKALAKLSPESIVQMDKAVEFVMAKGTLGPVPSSNELGAACIAFVEAALAVTPASEGLKSARAALLDAVLQVGLIRPDQIISAMRANIGMAAFNVTQHS